MRSKIALLIQKKWLQLSSPQKINKTERQNNRENQKEVEGE
jgi:hypothetical protein